MNTFSTNRIRVLYFILSVFIALSFASNPPDGKTGAPFDGLCSDCHGGGSFDGDLILSGIPGQIMPNTSYNLTLTISGVTGNPLVGGFQIVAVNQNNQNSGDLINTTGETGTSFSGGREYLDQRGAKAFSGDNVSWNFDWTSPNGPNGTIRFYFSGNIANGNGSSSGDKILASSESYPLVGGGDPLSVTLSKTNVTCFGEMDGTATASVSGGVPPYEFSWSNGGILNPITGLGPGLYSLTVTDNDNTTATNTIQITEPSLLKLNVQIQSHVSCPGGRDGKIIASASGGIPPYNFIYSTGSPNNLTAGIYNVTVSDGNNCSTEMEYEIIEPEAYNIELLQLINPACPDDSSGIIAIQVSGANPPYKYKWNSGEITDSIFAKAIGTYNVTITDNKNCGTTASYQLKSNDTIPPIFKAKPSIIYLDQNGQFVLNANEFVDMITDNCDQNPKLSISPDTLACQHIGMQEFIITASDKFGNKSFDTLQLEVKDSLAPTLIVWRDTSFSACNIIVPKFSASDNCALRSFTQTEGPLPGDIFNMGKTKLAFEATDSSGNVSTATFQVDIIQPLSIRLDTGMFEPCYGDTLQTVLSFSHLNKSPYSVYTNKDSLYFDSDTIFSFVSTRPDSIFIQVMDTTGCVLFYDMPVEYPDSLATLDSVQIRHQNQILSSLGSLLPFSSAMDSFHLYNDQQVFINNNGDGLVAGIYYLHVFSDSCNFIWGPFTISLITKTIQEKVASYKVFPNPLQNNLYIQYSGDQDKTTFELLNMQGSMVFEGLISPGINSIELNQLSAGMYCLKIKDQKHFRFFRLLKH